MRKYLDAIKELNTEKKERAISQQNYFNPLSTAGMQYTQCTQKAQRLYYEISRRTDDKSDANLQEAMNDCAASLKCLEELINANLVCLTGEGKARPINRLE